MALAQIEAYLGTALEGPTRGVAIFARAIDGPIFHALQFRVPVPNELCLAPLPSIYHLVQLKDAYHRYVVLITTQDRARILEVDVGTATSRLWAERPELRKRVGRIWSHEHYQNHRRNRGDKFIKEKIRLLERVVSGCRALPPHPCGQRRGGGAGPRAPAQTACRHAGGCRQGVEQGPRRRCRGRHARELHRPRAAGIRAHCRAPKKRAARRGPCRSWYRFNSEGPPADSGRCTGHGSRIRAPAGLELRCLRCTGGSGRRRTAGRVSAVRRKGDTFGQPAGSDVEACRRAGCRG